MAGGIRISVGKAWMVGTPPILHLLQELKNDPAVMGNILLKSQIEQALDTDLLVVSIADISEVDFEVFVTSVVACYKRLLPLRLPYECRLKELLKILSDDLRSSTPLKELLKT